MFNELADAREYELQTNATQIEYRRQWSDMRALERLETAIIRARGLVRMGPATSAR